MRSNALTGRSQRAAAPSTPPSAATGGRGGCPRFYAKP
jgi:hypothetical protein